MTRFVALVSLIFLSKVHYSTSSDREREKTYEFYGEHRLVLNASIKSTSVQVADAIDCVFACTSAVWSCSSVNIATTPQENGLFVCDLLSGTRFTSGTNMTKDKNYNYYSVKVGKKLRVFTSVPWYYSGTWI